MKRCPYCLRSHARARARYCSPEHARLAALQNQRVDGRYRRAMAKLKRHREQLALTSSQWRGVATGRKSVEELTAEVFGVSEIPPFRDPAA